MAAWNFSDQEWDALDRLQFSTTDVVCRKREGSLRELRRGGAHPARHDQPSVPREAGRKGPFRATEEALGQSVGPEAVSPPETLSGRLSWRG
jgi:hypothetical protein